MEQRFIEHDGVDEAALPPHARDSRSGDRVSFLEAGLLHVKGGEATFARWSDVLGVREHRGATYVLVPRRSPAPPWIRVDPELLGEATTARFAQRLRDRLSGGGYRDAVRRRRQDLSTAQLLHQVRAREEVAGALEVPSTIKLGGKYPGLWLGQLAAFGLGVGAGYLLLFLLMLVGVAMREPAFMLVVQLMAYFALFGGMIGGGLGAREVAKRWKARVDATRPRQRVLVLAPDGCVVGFRTGVRALKWSQVGRFEIGPTRPDNEDGLVVRGLDGKILGDIAAAWLDAPLDLVVAIAETYRRAATDSRSGVRVDVGEEEPAFVEVPAQGGAGAER